MRTLLLRIFTFPISKPPDFLHTRPSMPLVDCSELQPPPRHLCQRYTGLSASIANDFFSHRDNELYYRDAYRAVKRRILDWNFAADGDMLYLPVACRAGCHRSVAMAERLAMQLSLWARKPLNKKVIVIHFSLAKAAAKDMDESGDAARRFEGLERRVVIRADGTIKRIWCRGRAYSEE